MVLKKGGKKYKFSNAKQWAIQQEQGYEPSAITVPKGAYLFSLKKEGPIRLDIIPYVTTENNPLVQSGRLDEGDVHYERTYFTHGGIGLDEKSFACPRKNWGKPCPVCDFASKLSSDPRADQDLIKSLKPKMRQLFNVIDIEDQDKGIQVWEISYFNFGLVLAEKLKDADDESGYADFHNPESGFTLKCSVKQKKMGKTKFYAVTNIEMVPRRKPHNLSIIEKAYCLDDLPKELDYDELEEIFSKGASVRNGKASPTAEARGRSRIKDDEDEDKEETEEEEEDELDAPPDTDDEEETEEVDDPTAEDQGIEVGSVVEHNKHGECEVIKVSKDGTSLTLKNAKGKTFAAVAPGDCEVLVEEEEEETEEEEEEEVKPKRGGKKPKEEEEDELDADFDSDEPLEDEEEEETEEEEEEEEVKPKRGRRKK